MNSTAAIDVCQAPSTSEGIEIKYFSQSTNYLKVHWGLVASLVELGTRSDCAIKMSIILSYLHFYKDGRIYTYEQLATRLGIPENTLEDLMRRLLKSGWLSRTFVRYTKKGLLYHYTARTTLNGIDISTKSNKESNILYKEVRNKLPEYSLPEQVKLASVLWECKSQQKPVILTQKYWAQKWGCLVRQAGIDLRGFVADGYLSQATIGRNVSYEATEKGLNLISFEPEKKVRVIIPAPIIVEPEKEMSLLATPKKERPRRIYDETPQQVVKTVFCENKKKKEEEITRIAAKPSNELTKDNTYKLWSAAMENKGEVARMPSMLTFNKIKSQLKSNPIDNMQRFFTISVGHWARIREDFAWNSSFKEVPNLETFAMFMKDFRNYYDLMYKKHFDPNRITKEMIELDARKLANRAIREEERSRRFQ